MHRRGANGEVHIGSADGRIAIWCNEQEAHDLAALYGYRDTFSNEILTAIEEAYPGDHEDRPR